MQKCRAGADVCSKGGAEVKRCRGGEVLIMCRSCAEVQRCRGATKRCRGAGAEVQQRFREVKR